MRRDRNPRDERNLAVALTPTGRALRAQAERIPPAIVARLGIPIAELERLHGALTAVIAAASPGGNDAGGT